MKDWVWVIGGGDLQVPLIRAFQHEGYSVRVSDINPRCAASQYATVLPLSTEDWASHRAYAEAMATTPPKAVATAGTDVGPLVAALADRFNLTGCNPVAALRVANKANVRQALDLPYPKWAVRYPNERASWNGPWPVFVKPANASASRGIVRVAGPEADLDAAVQYAVSFNRNGVQYALLEEAIDADLEVASDWFVQDGKVRYVNGCTRVFDELIAIAHINPWIAPPEVEDLAQRTVDALGLDEGPFKFDLLRSRTHGWTVLECATRWSGEFDHSVSACYSTGRDLSQALARYYLGRGFDSTLYDLAIKRYVAMYAPRLPEGLPISEALCDEFEAQPRILRAIPLMKISERVTSCANRPMFIVAEGTSPEAALEAAREAERAVNGWLSTVMSTEHFIDIWQH